MRLPAIGANMVTLVAPFCVALEMAAGQVEVVTYRFAQRGRAAQAAQSRWHGLCLQKLPALLVLAGVLFLLPLLNIRGHCRKAMVYRWQDGSQHLISFTLSNFGNGHRAAL